MQNPPFCIPHSELNTQKSRFGGEKGTIHTLAKSNVRLFASSRGWIEGEAIRQLYAAATFDGMRLAVGFPDLHPGKGSPVGTAFVTDGLIYPYLVKPLGDGESRAWSLAHGAGRKWSRSAARRRMRERFGMHQLTQTPLGGRVICEERDLLYEEVPAAYKHIEDVIQELVDAGLASVIATFRPLLTYKTRAFRR